MKYKIGIEMLEDTELVWVSLTEGMGVLDWVRGLYSRLGGPVGYGVFFLGGGALWEAG